MSRTKKSAINLTRAFIFFSDWMTGLWKDMKELGCDNEYIIYKFFTDTEKRKEIARMIVNNFSTEKRILFPGNEYLELISDNEKIIIEECDGLYQIEESNSIFKHVFKYTGYDSKDRNTERTTEKIEVGVYELTKLSTFSQIFQSIDCGMDKLCLTHHQIKKFIQRNKKWLRKKNDYIFFLSKSDNNYFGVALYFVSDGGLGVSVCPIENTHVWDDWILARVVLPQLN